MQLCCVNLSRSISRKVAIFVFGLLVSMLAKVAAGEVLPGQMDQFADANVTFRLPVPKGVVTKTPTVAWQISSNHRTLARGTARLRLASDLNAKEQRRPQIESPGSVWLLEILTPKVNHGVVVEATLSFQLPGSESPTNTAIRLHHRDSLESIGQTLTAKGVAMLDSSESTRVAFDSLSWQPRRIKSFDQVETPSIVILGEAIHWDSTLIAEAELKAIQGTKFIVLQPDAKSSWPVSLDPIRTKRLELFQSLPAVPGTSSLDDRFWHEPEKRAPGWKLTGNGKEMQIEPSREQSSDSTAGWQLIQVQVGDHGGGFLFVGYNLIERFDQSPVPRETLKKLLLWSISDSEQNVGSVVSSQSR
jgi:hypothetical protein